jgi:hypothetical protein
MLSFDSPLKILRPFIKNCEFALNSWLAFGIVFFPTRGNFIVVFLPEPLREDWR